jgi:hypothetical protein
MAFHGELKRALWRLKNNLARVSLVLRPTDHNSATRSHPSQDNPNLSQLCLPMRRPTIFPLFWSKSEGFDYALYHRVQTEAEVFKVDALHDWIRDKKYLDAIHMHTLKAVKEDLDEMKEDTRLSNYSQDCYVVSRLLCLPLSTPFTR